MGYMTCSPQATTTAKTQSWQRHFKRARAHSKARNAYWVSTLMATAKQFGWKKKRGQHYLQSYINGSEELQNQNKESRLQNLNP
jgi:hypothetical protein